MGDIVQGPALSCEAVLFPLPLDMDQRCLTQAVNSMLQRRERNRIIEFLHPDLPVQNNSTTSTKFGKPVAVNRHFIV